MRKCSILLLIVLLLSSFQNIPYQVFAEEVDLDETEQVEAYVVVDDAEYVDIYEDSLGETVKTSIPNESLVLLMTDLDEATEQFIQINFEDIDSNELVSGYVDQDHLVIEETEDTIVEEEQLDEAQDEEAIELENEVSQEEKQVAEEKQEQSEQTEMAQIETKQANVKQSSVRLEGIALQSSTNVYADKSTQSNVLKSYRQGHTLIFNQDDKNWYKATVYIKGKAYSGYIYKEDVDVIDGDETAKEGNALLPNVSVYERPSKEAKSLKTYPYGTKLKYRTFSSNWYVATVYVDGVRHTGYIYHQDVSPAVQGESVGEALTGVGLKIPTNVYASTSKSSQVLRSYKQGHLLKFREYTENWYIATVYLNGVAQTGYIHKDDVGSPNSSLQGIAQKAPTHVYSSMSTNSASLKGYPAGHKLVYRPHNSDWYIATVYVNGVRHTGYIHHDHVGETLPSVMNYALKQPTHVYASTSKNAQVLRSYNRGHLLKFQPHNDNWYRAVVIISGVRKTGYIHHDDVGLVSPGKTVVIDAGHGGHDPGASGNGIVEKSLALNLSKIAKKMLEDAGINVIMTRETDEYLTLGERSRIANNSNADLFVSIHGNSFNGTASGIETYWYDKYASADSQKLASEIQSELIKETNGRNRGVKKGNFHVIRETKVPSALVEVGFIDHPGEAEKLKQASYQQGVVRGIVNGILSFLK